MAATLPYPERYEAAVRFAELPEGQKGLSQDVQLMLYALKRQVSEGPSTNASAPGFFNVVENAKYQAWKQLGSMSVMEAMRLYVRTVEEEKPDWFTQLNSLDRQGSATTPGSDTAASQQQQGQGQAPATNGTAAGVAQPKREIASVASFARDDVWSCVATEAAEGGKRPCPRYEHGAAQMGGKLYVVGGNYAGRYLSDVWRLDLATSQWELVSPPMQSTPSQQQQQQSQAEQPLQRQESSAAAAGLSPVAGHTVTAWEGKLLLLGGHVKAKTAAAAGSMPVRVLEPAAGTQVTQLEQGAPGPKARGGHSATLLGGSVWVFGGEDATRKPLDDLWRLDLGSMAWSEPLTKEGVVAQAQAAGAISKKRPASSLWPAPRSAHSAVAYLDRYLVVFGGGSAASCFSDVWVLDTAAEGGPAWLSCELTGHTVTPRAGHSAVVCGDVMHVVGGGNNVKGCTDLLALDLAHLKQHAAGETSGSAPRLVWHSLASTPARDPLSSEGVSLLVLQQPSATPVLVAFGGYNGKYHNVVSVINVPQLPEPQQDTADAAAPAGDAAAPDAGDAAAAEAATQNGSAQAAAPAAGAAGEGAGNAEGKATGAPSTKPAAGVAAAAAAAPAPPPTPQLQQMSELDSLKSEVIRLKAALSAAQEEAEAAGKQAAAAAAKDAAEMAQLRKQLAHAQAALETASKGLEDSRAALARESARVLRLEAEVAELKHQLGAAAEEQKELEALRRQVKEATMNKSRSGIWGYIAGQ